MGRELDERLEQHRIRQMVRCQLCVVEPPRQALGRSLLIAKAAGQLGLAAGLLVANGLDKVSDAFALMAMCPGQHMHDIIVETSSRRVLRSHTPRLAERRQPWLLVTLSNVSRLQGCSMSCGVPHCQEKRGKDSVAILIWMERFGV